MAESSNVTNDAENACEMKASVEVPIIQENESNEQFIKSQSSSKSDDFSDEKIAKLMDDKLQLNEREKELERITADLLKEHRRLTAERQSHERTFISSDRNATSIADQIRTRLLLVYYTGKANERVFQTFLGCSKKILQLMLDGDSKVAFQRKVTQLETMFSKYREQLTTIELLIKPDYDILCINNPECFKDVMTECNKVDESIYNIMSLILQK